MASKTKKTIITMIVIFLIGYANGVIYVSIHESVHRNIFYQNNISSITHIDYIKITGYTQAEPNSPSCEGDCKLEQNLADVVGYNAEVLIFTFYIGLFIYANLKIWIIREEIPIPYQYDSYVYEDSG